MPDREKVIKDLDECMNASCRGFRPRISCPYNDDEWDVMRDALALLKEQEAQLVLNIGQQISCKSGSCPKCGKMLNTTCNKRYCGDCGQELKWNA